MSERGSNIKVAFYTLGCKLNQAETESLAAQFNQAGYQLVSHNDVADIYIANTCTVTHIADRKSRHWLRLARQRNPQAFIIATGCYAERVPYELAPIADLVLGNEGKGNLLEIVEGLPLPAHALVTDKTTSSLTRVRSLIKIQDGCHSPCAYCIVPRVRAGEYSVPASQIIEEIKDKIAMGYKEVILTGTKIGCYKDAVLSANKGSSTGLENLVERILRDTDVKRLRLSSLQPQEISPELLTLWRDAVPSRSEGPRLCRHLHLALQSGNDATLHRMKRRYSLSDYHRALNLIRGVIPGVAITTDIMVGFPGETDEEFEQSYLFCQQAGFANIHVFPFSARPGTAAAEMPDQLSARVKKERSHRMLELAQRCRHSFCEQFLGQIMWVLWEKETSSGSGVYSGLTDNYNRVFTRSQKSLTNKIAPVKLVGFHSQGMWGELVGENSG
jgi:threonylcarbamoyladenosine tRNA methylthiotransferase MtaB